MAFKYNKLRGRIIEKFGSIRAFADAYGISLNSMSRKLTGKMAISTKDIVKMAKLLGIEPHEYHEYFFAV